jgi:hypothetical protein
VAVTAAHYVARNLSVVGVRAVCAVSNDTCLIHHIYQALTSHAQVDDDELMSDDSEDEGVEEHVNEDGDNDGSVDSGSDNDLNNEPDTALVEAIDRALAASNGQVQGARQLLLSRHLQEDDDGDLSDDTMLRRDTALSAAFRARRRRPADNAATSPQLARLLDITLVLIDACGGRAQLVLVSWCVRFTEIQP